MTIGNLSEQDEKGSKTIMVMNVVEFVLGKRIEGEEDPYKAYSDTVYLDEDDKAISMNITGVVKCSEEIKENYKMVVVVEGNGQYNCVFTGDIVSEGSENELGFNKSFNLDCKGMKFNLKDACEEYYANVFVVKSDAKEYKGNLEEYVKNEVEAYNKYKFRVMRE